MSYTIYNITNVLSQYFKLDVSKIDLELNYFNNLHEYILHHNNNIIKINYKLDKNNNIWWFCIIINYNNILTYHHHSNIKLISDNLIINKYNINNKMYYLCKNYNNETIFAYDCENDYNYLLLINKQIFKRFNLYLSINYKNNIIYNIYSYCKKNNIYYINYFIFKKICINNELYCKINKINNNFLLHKILLI